MANSLGLSILNKYLAYHRQEKDLNYSDPDARNSSGPPTEHWDNKLVNFQRQIKLFYDGNIHEGKLKDNKLGELQYFIITFLI